MQVSNSQTFPNRASVVVIGGGIMGCSTLYHLAKQGISDVILLERNKLTSGTTWHSAAQVRALRSSRNLTELIRYSIDLYSRLEGETGQATGWINKGSLSIATNGDRLVHIQRQAALAKIFGVRAEIVSVDETRNYWPHMNTDDVLGAVWSPDDGRVSPSDLCAALVKGATARGARIYEETSVTGIVTNAGRVKGVETANGYIRCDAIAVCAGLWSRNIGEMAGTNVPLWPCEHFYLLTKPVEGITGNLPTLSDHDGHLYIRDDSGGLLIGCFEPMGKPIDPDLLGNDFAFQLLPDDWDHFEPMMINALHRLPALETAEVKMLLNGPESFTPDGVFLLGETGETRGLYLGCGMNSVGVATGGGAGMALAHCILEGRTPTDLHECDPCRFPPSFNSVRILSERAPEVLGKHYEITFPGRQWSSARNLRRLPLDLKWRELRAQFGQYYDWERPLYFSSLQKPNLTFERPDWHEQVGLEVAFANKEVAIFDQSSFGKIDVRGPDAESFLNRICSNDMSRPVGRAVYTTMLNEQGGIKSDLTAIRVSTSAYRLFTGSNQIQSVLSWLNRHLDNADIEMMDVSHKYAVLALMGPKSDRIVSAVGADELNRLKYFEAKSSKFAGIPIHVVRLSYVGEAGWEITCLSEDAEDLFNVLTKHGAQPAGLYAQTSMRIEKRFLAYGHDIDTDTCPLDAGLEFTLDWNSNFIGHQEVKRRLRKVRRSKIATIIFEDTTAVPIGDEPVEYRGQIIGKTTSAAFGYRIGAPLALVLVHRPGVLKKYMKVSVKIADRDFKAQLIFEPAFDPRGERMRSRVFV